jgi:hypothetical protein
MLRRRRRRRRKCWCNLVLHLWIQTTLIAQNWGRFNFCLQNGWPILWLAIPNKWSTITDKHVPSTRISLATSHQSVQFICKLLQKALTSGPICKFMIESLMAEDTILTAAVCTHTHTHTNAHARTHTQILSLFVHLPRSLTHMTPKLQNKFTPQGHCKWGGLG